MIRALGLDDSVTLHGPQPHSFVLEVLSRSDYFLQHSVKAPNGDMEGTPVGVLEAMGMGLPVISTRHAGICDIVAQDETGVLVEEYDVDAMALAMNRLCDDQQLASRMGSSARESVINNWTATKSIKRLAEIVQSVLDKVR
jgi:glycosyltransferase involved in cell wall biosynthesis